jgi:hypothetical protein
MSSKYNALWYYHCFGKYAYAISESLEKLMTLHEESIVSPGCFYHQISSTINKVIVEPIECYTYNNKIIEPFNDSHIKLNHNFYAFNSLPNNNNGDDDDDNNDNDNNDDDDDDDDEIIDEYEVLVYMSEEDHKLWLYYSNIFSKIENKKEYIMDSQVPKFFYTFWPSDSPVIPDVYYEESIMNT